MEGEAQEGAELEGGAQEKAGVDLEVGAGLEVEVGARVAKRAEGEAAMAAKVARGVMPLERVAKVG